MAKYQTFVAQMCACMVYMTPCCVDVLGYMLDRLSLQGSRKVGRCYISRRISSWTVWRARHQCASLHAKFTIESLPDAIIYGTEETERSDCVRDEAYEWRAMLCREV